MSTSSVQTVRQQLFTLLTTAMTATTVKVSYSIPFATELPVECAYGGDVSAGDSSIPVMTAGRKKREETYLLDWHFNVVKPGASSKDAQDRAYVLYAYLEDLLANDPGIGLSASMPTLRCWIETYDDTTTPDESTSGWRCRVTAHVRVSTRLD